MPKPVGDDVTAGRPLFHVRRLAYDSPYVSLAPVELFSVVPRGGGGYQALGRLSPTDRSLLMALSASSRHETGVRLQQAPIHVGSGSRLFTALRIG